MIQRDETREWEYHSLEEALYRLSRFTLGRAKPSLKIWVYPKEDKLYYSIVEQVEDLIPSHALNIANQAIKHIFKALQEQNEAFIGFEDIECNKLYSYVRSEEVGLLYFGDIQLRKKAKDHRKVKIPIIEFENKVVCETLEDYLRFFSLENNYINRGKVMAWVNQQKGEAKNLRNRRRKFDPNKVVDMYMGKNSFGKEMAILVYEGLPQLAGFGPIIRTFPDLTEQEALNLYKRFLIPPPSTLKRYFKGENKKEKVQTPTNMDSIIEEYNLYKTPEGFMNVKALLTWGQDIVVKSSAQLLKELRALGAVVTQSESKKIWEKVMEDE